MHKVIISNPVPNTVTLNNMPKNSYGKIVDSSMKSYIGRIVHKMFNELVTMVDDDVYWSAPVPDKILVEIFGTGTAITIIVE